MLVGLLQEAPLPRARAADAKGARGRFAQGGQETKR